MKALAIEDLRSDNSRALGELFEALQPEADRFHPHPLTREHARKLCADPQGGTYIVVLIDEVAVAYGMLRGWREHPTVPSLGIAVHPDHRGKRIGRLLMEYLRVVASLRGAKKIRLKVYPENKRAIRLYVGLGYVFEDTLEDGQHVATLAV